MHREPSALDERAIAVVGASCRLPGGITGLEQMWDALRDQRDLITEMPADRFDTSRFVDTQMPRPGKSYTAAGGFLDDVAGFDSAYFGIPPKEAAQMDPHHRLLLELATEALDDAAIDPEMLAGTDTAVYVGISDTSYASSHIYDPRGMNPYTMSGGALSIAANRLSHTFDLRGPSMVVDTACSSSLVALDRGCRTLWEGTSRTVLCGGANVLLSPYHYVGFSQAAMLSRRGRCAAFDADADGFVRAEGGGLVVLKRLPDAVADGDRVLGLILGTGSNCDGRTMGLALPSAEAQEALLRSTYARAGVHPNELVYFEAHGTGTAVGDPLEARAIGQALGMRRIAGPLPIGSVKTNTGHLEPASGMAGLCKALLVLRHRLIPASLHAAQPSPDIDFTGLGIDLVAENRPLADTPRPVVGVNSFGFGGANAHAIVAAAPPPTAPAPCTPPPEGLPVLVSARTEPALAEAASRMARRLTDADPHEFYDIAYTSCRRRAKHEHRAAVLAATAEDAAERLTLLTSTGKSSLVKAVRAGRVAFVYAGNGTQWAGMGADLMAHDAVFQEAVKEVDGHLAPLLGWSITDYLAKPAQQWQLAPTEVTQPLLFAVQAGLTRMLRAWGVDPAVAFGHSVGEVAAAYAAGALTLAQACQVIAVRSQAQAETAGSGRMAAAGLPREQAVQKVEESAGQLEIAGINSDQDVTFAGSAEALAVLGEHLTAQGVFFRDLDMDYAFHSSAMDPQHEPVRAALTTLTPQPARVPFISTVTGSWHNGAELDATYWWRNLREPVAFAAAVKEALDDGVDIFLEISPHPALRTYLRRLTAARPQTTTAVLPTLRRGADGPLAMAGTRAALLAAGARTDWTRYFPRPGQVTGLFPYPWQRARHWNVPADRTYRRPAEHPLLGSRIPAPSPLWSGPVEPVRIPWLADHRVAGSVLMPATGYVEMAQAAARAVLDAPVEVEHLDISSALVVPWADASAVHLQVALNPDDGVLMVSSTDDHSREPRLHARARVRALIASRPAPLELDALAARCTQQITAEEHYTACARAGLDYGPSFRVLSELHTDGTHVLARYAHQSPGAPYAAHPALLDAALQAGFPLLADLVAQGQAYLPASIGAVRVWATPSAAGCITVRERSRTENEVCWDVTIADPDGTVTARLEGCRLRRFSGSARTSVAVHHTVLRVARHENESGPAHSPVPLPAQVTDVCAPRIAEACKQFRELRFAEFTADGSAMWVRELAAAVASLLPDPLASFTWDELVGHGMQERHLRLTRLMQPAMERHGVLHRKANGRLCLSDDPAGTDATHAAWVRKYPQFLATQALFAQHSAHLADILRGVRDPMELLADETSAKMLEQFYDTAPFCRLANRLAQTMLQEIVRNWPAGRPLRILEVGAGTGGLTAALLPLLPADLTRYCFTDASPFFFSRARKRFAAYDFLDYRTLDLDVPPSEQGFTPYSFDLVVAGNALHTANDLARAVRHVAGLLAPGGGLLATEVHDPEVLAPIFGTLDSFYSNTDTALRPRSILLPRAQWPGLLKEAGFQHVVNGTDNSHHDGSVLLATLPVTPSHDALAQPGLAAQTSFLVTAETPDELPFAQTLAETLPPHNGRAAVAALAPETCEQWQDLLSLAAAGEEAGTPGVLLVLGRATEDDPDAAISRTARRAGVLRAGLAACASGLADHNRADVWVVTRPSGAVESGMEAEQPADAAIWGMTRCLSNELPQVCLRRVSLHRTADLQHDARRIARELSAPGDEDEIILAEHGRFVPREQHRPTTRAAAKGLSYTLKTHNPGLSYTLAWHETVRPTPGPGEVLLEVKAAALNYRDLMQSTGLLPAEAVEGTLSEIGMGLECAGIVAACGEGVTHVQPGDRVAGMAAASLSSYTLSRAEGLLPLPADMTFAQAATRPVAYATVLYSLRTLARLQPGETVLVHGAAGGVGLAALNYAAHCGAHVIATAGSDLKRNCLRAVGIKHVLDSRSLDFADQVRTITDNDGVDVVLNSLSGEAIPRSLELLRAGGRFLELGKRDFYENRQLLLRPFTDNLAFFGVDLNKVISNPRLLADLQAQFEDPALDEVCRPLPHTAFPAARVQEAFTFLQHSRHIGKVLVTFDPLDEPPHVRPLPRSPRLDPRGTYLITGGTSGFGAATAQWLAALGARHIALTSRRGPAAPEAAATLSALHEQGVEATAYAADAADLAAMTRVVTQLDAGGHPLRGVVHAAMHLDDELLSNLDDERLAAVMRPKIGGALVLDRLTRNRDCDLFLMYSSGTASVGNLRQAPYAAGNLYLEALVRNRRRRGQAGLAIAWGMLGETGYAARNELTASMASLGIEPISTTEAFTAARVLLQQDADVAGVVRYDAARVRHLLPLAGSPRLAGLFPAVSGTQTDGAQLRELGQLSADEALLRLADLIAAQIADVLHMDKALLDVHRPLDEYGLDSLMTAELLVKLQQEFNLEIPPMELMRYIKGNITDLAQVIQLRLGLGHSTQSAQTVSISTDTRPQQAATLPRQPEATAEGMARNPS
ncbi:type I polyketide synthase [Streptomyces aureocirculatus]|uniref:type I polyketide synthase n=1 Tax=Streptomyces aureocirculatus TaxID=67275 RepID=UPI00099BCA87|nr:type I polyketide synthase [Streptomyces aureocirculatus]